MMVMMMMMIMTMIMIMIMTIVSVEQRPGWGVPILSQYVIQWWTIVNPWFTIINHYDQTWQ